MLSAIMAWGGKAYKYHGLGWEGIQRHACQFEILHPAFWQDAECVDICMDMILDTPHLNFSSA